jgi:hypothetical protein
MSLNSMHDLELRVKKVKLKLSLYLTKLPCHENVLGSGEV